MEFESTDNVRTWYVSPPSWLAYIMSTDPGLLTGPGDAESNLRNFWNSFRQSHPHHELYLSPHLQCMERVLPIILHGDEGRGLKKGKVMVTSLQSPLGSTPRPRLPCDCCEVLSRAPHLPQYGVGDDPDPYSLSPEAQACLREQNTNYRGSTWLSRWLLFSLGSWIYLKRPEILETMVARVASDLRSLFFEGVEIQGRRFYAACIGVKGDLDYHRQVYALLRSYAHVGTHHTGSICHACLAGGQGPMFEDYSELPGWVLTNFASRPWDTNIPAPSLVQIPSYPAPEELIQLDPFHVLKMGVGRSVAGGILVFLCRRKYFDYPGSTTNFPDRLDRAHTSFRMFCSAEKLYPALRSFSKAFLNMKSFASAPWTATKGADTMLMIRWLRFFLALTLQSNAEPQDVPVLKLMLAVCEAMLSMTRIMHTHGIWMDRVCGRRLYIEIMRVLRGYQLLGSRCLSLSYRAFIQKPKNHALHHIGWKIREQLSQGAAFVLNPETFSCEPDQDYIGRVARLSRKLDVRKQGFRVFRRIFYKVRAVRRRFRKTR